MHRDAHFGDIDGDKSAAIFTGENAAGFDRLPAPGIESKDPIGFRNGIPALDIGELAAVGLARPDLPPSSGRRSACSCFAEKPITAPSRSILVPDWRGDALISAPSLSSLSRAWRLSLGSPGCQ